ncbi:MAG TPA: tRNA (guanosine(37)-N1)-methyltransferase TrmD [Candidatus Magasanikbacteria bacterium]|nr:tRNA (guanosine(37)-N1)-methyltransferase TrmD [Candidatus Magasanikbacteria bacterium]
MKFEVLTIFPEIINDYCSKSILGKAEANGLIEVISHNFRDFTLDKHNRVDDSPYGGGAGMVLQVQPIFDCLKKIGAIGSDGKKLKIKNSKPCLPVGRLKILAMDPAGKKFDQRMAEKLSKNYDRLVFICGRYEGFDERIYKFVDEKVSVGDYVLAGGELPALTIIETVSRLIPGVLGNAESLKDETHNQSKIIRRGGLKSKIIAEYPQYTRPENFMGLKVPKVLLSGNHKDIENWRWKKQK